MLVQQLKAILLIAPTADVRYYLNGVCFRNGTAWATNGHIAIRLLNIQYSADLEDVIVPSDMIAQLLRGARAKHDLGSVVTITPKELSWTRANGMTIRVPYTPILGSFPAVGGVIERPIGTHDRPVHVAAQYLRTLGDVAALLQPDTDWPGVALRAGASNAAIHYTIGNICAPVADGVVMPILL